MGIDLGKLQVERVIVHEIPARPVRGTQPKPTFSEIESPLTPGLKNYFRERITNTLDRMAFEVRFEPGSPSPIPALVLEFLNDTDTDFVELSKKIARHLHLTQTGVNPSGLLVVSDMRYSTKAALAILKLEKEQAVRVKQGTYQNKKTFDIEHLRDLMLGERTRVFKVGLFVPRGKTLETIDGRVADTQRGFQPKTEVAEFFLAKFLGCRLREDPGLETKRFFQAAERYINESVADPAEKAQYQMALLSELHSAKTQVRPKQFAETYLRGGDRQAFVTFLTSQNVPVSPIEKDVTLIAAQLKRLQIDFESGIAVIGTPESFDKHIQMQTVENGAMRVEIKDHVKTVHGRR